MKEESGYKNAYVIATGGLGKIIADETECIDLYDPQLTLNGLRMIHEKVQKKDEEAENRKCRIGKPIPIRTYGRGDRPAFSFAVQGTGSGSFRDGNG